MREEEKEIDKILEELFDRGKRYGEDIGYAKDEALYEMRIDAMDEAKAKVATLLSSQLKEVLELVQSNTEGTFTDDGGNDCWYIDKLVEAIKELAGVEKLV